MVSMLWNVSLLSIAVFVMANVLPGIRLKSFSTGILGHRVQHCQYDPFLFCFPVQPDYPGVLSPCYQCPGLLDHGQTHRGLRNLEFCHHNHSGSIDQTLQSASSLGLLSAQA